MDEKLAVIVIAALIAISTAGLVSEIRYAKNEILAELRREREKGEK